MKPDGVATAAMEAMEGVEAEPVAETAPVEVEPQQVQAEEVKKPQPEVTPPANKTKSSKAGEPKAKAKIPAKTTTKTPQKSATTAITKTSETSGSSSRPGTAKSRPANGAQKQPTSNGVTKKPSAAAPEKKKLTPTPAQNKRAVGTSATSPAKPAEKKPAAAVKPTSSPAASSGAKPTGTTSANKKVPAAQSNGMNAKAKATAPRPASAALSKPNNMAATKPDKPAVSKTTRSASGTPGLRAAPVAPTAKAASASPRPVSSKSATTASSAGRTSGQSPKPATPAKKDVGKPTTTPAKKPSESVIRPSPAKISKSETPKLTVSKPDAAAKRPPSSSKPAESKPARPTSQESKASASPKSTGSKTVASKAAAATPKKPVGSSTPMPVKRTPKPTQPVQPISVVEESTSEKEVQKIIPAATDVALAPAPSELQNTGLDTVPHSQKEEVPEAPEPQKYLGDLVDAKAEVVNIPNLPSSEGFQDPAALTEPEETVVFSNTTDLFLPSSPLSSEQLPVQSPIGEDKQTHDLSETQSQPVNVAAEEHSLTCEPQRHQEAFQFAALVSVSEMAIPSNDLPLTSPAGEYEVAVEKADEEINVDNDDEGDEEESDLQTNRNQPMEESVEESADLAHGTDSNDALTPEAEDVSSSYQDSHKTGMHESQQMDESEQEMDDLIDCAAQKQPLSPELDTENEGVNGSHQEVPEHDPYVTTVEESVEHSADLASCIRQQSDSTSRLDAEDDVNSSNQDMVEQDTRGTVLVEESLKKSADLADYKDMQRTPTPEIYDNGENANSSYPVAPEHGAFGSIEFLKESVDQASCTGLQYTPTSELDSEEDVNDYHQEEVLEQDTHVILLSEEPLKESTELATCTGLQHTPTPEVDTDDEEVIDSHQEVLQQGSQGTVFTEETLKESSNLPSCIGLQHTPTPEEDTEDEGMNNGQHDNLEHSTRRTLTSEEPLNPSTDMATCARLQHTLTPELDTEDEEENDSNQEAESQRSCETHLVQESMVESTNLACSTESHHTLMLELDSEDVDNCKQELKDRRIPDLLQDMESAYDLADSSLRGCDEECAMLSDNIEVKPEIPEKDDDDDEEEEEQEDDIEGDDMDVGLEHVDEPYRELYEKYEINEDREVTNECVMASRLENSKEADENLLSKENRMTDMSQDLPLAPAQEEHLHSLPQLVPSRPPDFASEPYASDPTIDLQPPWLELGAVTHKQDSLLEAADELDSPVEEREPGVAASAICQPGSQGAAELAGHCSSSSETGTPEELVDYDSSSGVESRSEGKQRTPVPPAQPDIEQDLGIHLERGDCEGEEEEAETLPADEVLGDPPTAHTSAPSTPSTSGDEASDTEGEMQMNDPATHSTDTAAFDGKTGAHDLSALDEGVEGEEDGGTPQSAASAPSYAFDCPTSNAHSTAESCGKSPGLFSLENEDQLPEEAKDPSLVRELTLPAAAGNADFLGSAVDLLPIDHQHKDEDEEAEEEEEEEEEEEADEEDQYLLCGKPGIELSDPLGPAGTMETDLHLPPHHSPVEDPDAQPPYFSAICDKTDNALAGRYKSAAMPEGTLQPPPLRQRWCWQLLPQRGSLKRGESMAQNGTRHLPSDHQTGLAGRLPSNTKAQTNLQLRRLEQHQLQLEQIQKRQEQERLKRLKLEEEQQERLKELKVQKNWSEPVRLRQLEAEQREERLKRLKLEAEHEEQRRLKLEEELQWQEKQRLLKEQRQELLQLQLHHQAHEQRQRQLFLQWQQQELNQQQQQQLRAQTSGVLSPSSGLCTIYEAMETTEDDEEEEERNRMKQSYSVPVVAGSPSLHPVQSDLPAHVCSSALSCPQLNLDLNHRLETVQQLINQTLLLAGDIYPPMLLLPGGIGGTLSPLETDLWPTVLPPLRPPSATVTSVSCFSPDCQGRCPRGDWTVVELETHH
ncbi:protein piccolo-like [Arapaima gigas]